MYYLVAKGVGVEVVDVRHVDGILKHGPVTALELDLAIHRPPPGYEHGQTLRHLTA
jgi:hypothetical protein